MSDLADKACVQQRGRFYTQTDQSNPKRAITTQGSDTLFFLANVGYSLLTRIQC